MGILEHLAEIFHVEVYAARLHGVTRGGGISLPDLEFLATKQKPQRFLSRHLDVHVSREFSGACDQALVSLEQDPHAAARNRLRAVMAGGPYCSAHLVVPPAHHETTCYNVSFISELQLRPGHSQVLEGGQRCTHMKEDGQVCGELADPWGMHALRCKRCAGRGVEAWPYRQRGASQRDPVGSQGGTRTYDERAFRAERGAPGST